MKLLQIPIAHLVHGATLFVKVLDAELHLDTGRKILEDGTEENKKMVAAGIDLAGVAAELKASEDAAANPGKLSFFYGKNCGPFGVIALSDSDVTRLEQEITDFVNGGDDNADDN